MGSRLVTGNRSETHLKTGEFSAFFRYPINPLYTPLLNHLLPPINPLYAIYINLKT